MISRRQIKPLVVLLACFGAGCALLDNGASKKPVPTGLIATPPTYYSTTKARYLGSKYKDNLERLAERILRNSNTSQLQFANNISSVGGIGFFTHSATKTADERYLEVVLATPETFETKGEYSEKVNQLFSRYGQDLLAILAGDTQIYKDNDLSGYGLNFTWRTVLQEPPTNRIAMARAIIYLQKDKVAGFLRRDLPQNELLRDAVIFAVEEDGPLNLVSYQPRESKPDFRPAIREDNLVAGTAEAKPSPLPSTSEMAQGAVQKNETKVEPIRKELAAAQDVKARTAANKPVPPAEKPETKAPVVATQKERAPIAPSLNVTGEKSSPAKTDGAEKLALAKQLAKSPTMIVTPESGAEQAKISPLPAEPLPAAKEKAAEPITEKVREKALTAKTETSAKAANEKPAVPREETQVNAATTTPAPKIEPEKSIDKEAPPIFPPEPAKSAEIKKVNELPARAAMEKSPGTSAALKPSQEVKPKPGVEIRKQESASVPASVAPLPSAAPAAEVAIASVARAEKPSERAATPPVTAARQSDNAIRASGSSITTAPEAKARDAASVRPEAPPSVAAKTELSGEPKASDAAPAPLLVAKPAQPMIAPAPVKLPEVRKIEAPARAAAEKSLDSVAAPRTEMPVPDIPKAAQIKPPAAPPARVPQLESAALRKTETLPSEIKIAEAKAPAAPALRANPPESTALRKSETTTSETAKASEIRAPAAAAARATPAESATPGAEVKVAEVKVPAVPAVRLSEKAPEVAPARKIETAAAIAVAKAEPQPAKPAPMPAATTVPEKVAEKSAPEQLASLRKPVEPTIEKMPLARPAPRPLEGFIIQIAFSDKEKAQSWAEKMTQRGYAVSVTEAGAEGALRVRLGNFPVRDDAERQLRNFKQEGMNGIIINLPQAFRPEARSSLP